jgi:hypothetical protein
MTYILFLLLTSDSAISNMVVHIVTTGHNKNNKPEEFNAGQVQAMSKEAPCVAVCQSPLSTNVRSGYLARALASF